ncbi:MAG TPA: type II toxin-antitoxin system ParD family antitoxin [Planctomycetota bacterium]|nr:type II toxin-antitoxin system ParD family antitoxin [Planctomycetota bacterium]
MNVSLTSEQEQYIAEKVASGRYRSAAEVVREALRLFMEREDEERRRAETWREEVRRKIDEGFEEALRGELLDGEEVFERLRKQIEAQAKKGA